MTYEKPVAATLNPDANEKSIGLLFIDYIWDLNVVLTPTMNPNFSVAVE